MTSRIREVYSQSNRQGLDALLLSSPSNISYLSGLLSRDSYFLLSKKENFYITDSRYVQETKENLKIKATIIKIKSSSFKTVCSLCRRLGFRRVGFEGGYCTFFEYRKMKEGSAGYFELFPTYNLVEGLRQIKSTQEIHKIKKAVEIAVSTMRFIKDFIAVGRKEIEVAGEAERFIRYNGGCASAFGIIVASGAHSGFPHHLTSQRKIRKNEPVLVDLGVEYQGYKSDLTRVFFLGRITSDFRKIYDIVLKAQDRAIKRVKPAINIKIVDAAARQYITEKGYGGFFGHSLGHGVGLDVHESPRISPVEDNKLKRGMVFTIEPGIYLPGRFGVRIEDMVLVTSGKAEVLSECLEK